MPSRDVAASSLSSLSSKASAGAAAVVAPFKSADAQAPFDGAPIVYENQRYLCFKWRSPSLPMDRAEFSNELGTVQLAKPWPAAGSDRSPKGAPLYELVVVAGQTDAEGWEYALSFSSTYQAANSSTMCVRRRQWRRIEVVKKKGFFS